MSQHPERVPCDPWKPARFRIRVQGRLPESYEERLGGLNLQVEAGVAHPVTSLTGTLADQGALMGVLNSLQALHLPVLSVDRL